MFVAKTNTSIRTTFWLFAALACLTLLVIPAANSLAHNNPTFREDLLLTIPVKEGSPAKSDLFSITWPKKSVQLIWRVVDTNNSQLDAESIVFSVFQNDTVVAENLTTEAATQRFKGDGFRIESNAANSSAFTVELYAKVLDRSKNKKKS